MKCIIDNIKTILFGLILILAVGSFVINPNLKTGIVWYSGNNPQWIADHFDYVIGDMNSPNIKKLNFPRKFYTYFDVLGLYSNSDMQDLQKFTPNYESCYLHISGSTARLPWDLGSYYCNPDNLDWQNWLVQKSLKLINQDTPARNWILFDGAQATPRSAMKAQPELINGKPFYPSGCIIGKALGTLESGQGTIPVSVSRQ